MSSTSQTVPKDFGIVLHSEKTGTTKWTRNKENEDTKDYITPSEAVRRCRFSLSTLRLWADKGKIRCIRSPGGKRYYYLPDIKEISGFQDTPEEINSIEKIRETICYARVSSSKQRPDLDRQIQYLQEKYPEGKVISDVGSGLNYNRRGLQRLLKRTASGTVGQVVVTYSDRLCRYGIELLETLFERDNVGLVVLCEETSPDQTEELAKDVLDICNYFVAKYNGRKSYQKRKPKEKERFGTEERKERNSSREDFESEEISSTCGATIGSGDKTSLSCSPLSVQPVRKIVLRRRGEGQSVPSEETVTE